MKKITLFILFFFLSIIFLFSPFFLTLLGNFIIKKDPLQKADLIIVLAGEKGERMEYAASLYKQGYADKIILSGGKIVDFPGVPEITWAGIMRKYAIDLGIPEEVIFLQNKSRDTKEDALFSYKLAKELKAKSAIMVTSPYHSKRAYFYFNSIFKDIEIISAPVAESWYNPDEWWKSYKGRFQVIREYFAYSWILFSAIAFD